MFTHLGGNVLLPTGAFLTGDLSGVGRQSVVSQSCKALQSFLFFSQIKEVQIKFPFAFAIDHM